MQLSRKALDAYNAAIKQQGGNAENAARKALEAWFEENLGATVEQTRDVPHLRGTPLAQDDVYRLKVVFEALRHGVTFRTDSSSS